MNKLINTIKSKSTTLKGKVATGMAAMTAFLMTIVPTYATDVTINDLTGLDVNTLLGKIVSIVLTIAQGIGLVLLVSGIFQLIMAYKDDNADSKTRGIQLAIVGVVLITFKAILAGVGILQ